MRRSNGDEGLVDGFVDVLEGGEWWWSFPHLRGETWGTRFGGWGEEHLFGHGSAEARLVFGDVVLEGACVGEYWVARAVGEADDGGGGLGEAVGVGGVELCDGLVEEGAGGGAGGDVGEGVGGVGGVDEVGEEHDIVANAREGDVVGGEGAEDGFEVVNVLGEGAGRPGLLLGRGCRGRARGRRWGRWLGLGGRLVLRRVLRLTR